MQNVEIYYVAVVKDGYVCNLVSGPYLTADEASANSPESLSMRCSYEIVKQTIQVEIVN